MCGYRTTSSGGREGETEGGKDGKHKFGETRNVVSSSSRNSSDTKFRLRKEGKNGKKGEDEEKEQ